MNWVAVCLLVAAGVLWLIRRGRLALRETGNGYVPRVDSRGRVEGTYRDPYSPNHPVFSQPRDNGIEAALRELGVGEPICGFDYGESITCGLGQWAHEPHLGLGHEYVKGGYEEVPVDDEDEDDLCPGHRTVLGGLVSCDLPFGHRGVTGEPYDI